MNPLEKTDFIFIANGRCVVYFFLELIANSRRGFFFVATAGGARRFNDRETNFAFKFLLSPTAGVPSSLSPTAGGARRFSEVGSFLAPKAGLSPTGDRFEFMLSLTADLPLINMTLYLGGETEMKALPSSSPAAPSGAFWGVSSDELSSAPSWTLLPWDAGGLSSLAPDIHGGGLRHSEAASGADNL